MSPPKRSDLPPRRSSKLITQRFKAKKEKNTHDSNVAVGLQAKIQTVPRAQQNSYNGGLYQLGMNHAW